MLLDKLIEFVPGGIRVDIAKSFNVAQIAHTHELFAFSIVIGVRIAIHSDFSGNSNSREG